MREKRLMADHGDRTRCRRVVLIPCPFQGHMTPMLQLGTCLHSKGFSITVAHSEFNPPDYCNHPGFIFLPLGDKLSKTRDPTNVTDFLQFLQSLQALNDACKPRLQEQLIQIISKRKESKSVVVVYDNLMFFAENVAGELGLPAVILRSCSAVFFPAYEIIPRLHQENRFPAEGSLLQEIVPEVNPFRYKDLPFINRPIQQALHLITMITPKAPPSAFIYNTLEFLEESALTRSQNHRQVPVFTIGPLHKIISTPSTSFLAEDTRCLPWLDKQAPKSVIFVSLGSLVTIDEKVSTEMAWGLANSNHPFIWVVRPGSVQGCEWVEFLDHGMLAEMKGRGLIVKWAPQKQVLAHNAVGGFWSHCGWNSTLESVSEGVPMLCQPFNTDQMLNSRYLSHVWKIGVEVVVEKAEIEGAIRKVLTSEEGAEMKQRANEIRRKLKLAVSDGGSSRNSLNDLVDFIMSL